MSFAMMYFGDGAWVVSALLGTAVLTLATLALTGDLGSGDHDGPS